MKNKAETLKEAFERYAIKNENACWGWSKKLDNNVPKVNFKNQQGSVASRISWILYKGNIPKNYHVYHKCKNTSCTNPDHLYLAKRGLSLKELYEKNVIKKENQCWDWSTAKDKDGYGLISHKRKIYKAHRISWIIHNGEIQKELCVLHKCDNPPCTNPEHLFLGNSIDNNRDRSDKGRTYNKKISIEQVVEIKKLIKSGKSNIEIAKLYNVNESIICNLKKNKHYFEKYKDLEF